MRFLRWIIGGQAEVDQGAATNARPAVREVAPARGDEVDAYVSIEF